MSDWPPPDIADRQKGKDAAATPRRLHSLDAYRGLIMITLAFAGFGLADTAELHLKQHPQSNFWQQVEYQFEHVEWTGCSYWDLMGAVAPAS